MTRRRARLEHYITEEEYLRKEEKSSVRHEYVDGHMFAMSGSTDAHNVISGNIFAVIHRHLQGGPCRVYMNDMKVRLQSGKRYYYPDIMVSCESFEPKSIHKEAPVLLIEVLSKSTRSVDKREKLVAYQQLASLKEYVMIHQDRQQVEVYRRRADGRWEYEQLSIDEGLLLESLPGKPLSIPFSAIYGDYHPPTRVQEDENVSEYDFEYVDV